MYESIVFCSACTMSFVRKFTFAISSPDEFLVIGGGVKKCKIWLLRYSGFKMEQHNGWLQQTWWAPMMDHDRPKFCVVQLPSSENCWGPHHLTRPQIVKFCWNLVCGSIVGQRRLQDRWICNNGLFDIAAKAGLIERIVHSKQQTIERT